MFALGVLYLILHFKGDDRDYAVYKEVNILKYI